MSEFEVRLGHMQKPILIATFLVLSLAFAPAATAQDPQTAGYTEEGSIVVAPPNPEPGDDITVTVTGCSPAPGFVDVFIDGVLVGQAEVRPNGTFTERFTVPLEAEGEVAVEVECESEVLSSIVDVQVGTLPFQPPDDLPRTGSETQPLLQFAAGLVAVGVFFVVLGRRREQHQVVPAHAKAGPPRRSRELAEVGHG